MSKPTLKDITSTLETEFVLARNLKELYAQMNSNYDPTEGWQTLRSPIWVTWGEETFMLAVITRLDPDGRTYDMFRPEVFTT